MNYIIYANDVIKDIINKYIINDNVHIFINSHSLPFMKEESVVNEFIVTRLGFMRPTNLETVFPIFSAC